MAYGLASQNSVLNMLMLPRRTCSDRRYPELDFISHPEDVNDEMDLIWDGGMVLDVEIYWLREQ